MSDGRTAPASSPQPLYACLYQPPAPGAFRLPDEPGAGSNDRSHERPGEEAGDRERAVPGARRAVLTTGRSDPAPAAASPLVAVAEVFSPRYERQAGDVVVIDVSGLDRLLGPPRVVGDDLRREAATRGLRVHVALAATRMAALVLAHARPGVTVVGPGDEASALAPLPIRVLEQIEHAVAPPRTRSPQRSVEEKASVSAVISVVNRWGLRTLGEFAALPAADLRARLGPEGLRWQAMARGEDVRPLVPSAADERFESSIELEWPIEGAEPLSFVLTRLLEPLATRLERRDRGAAALHVQLRLITKEVHARRLQLPSPLRDVRTLRTLALLDLESHPPPAAIDQVIVTIDPTPARVVQHTLFTRTVPTPGQLATLLARLGALIGQDRVGAPAPVDTYRPGAFAMIPFATEHEERPDRRPRRNAVVEHLADENRRTDRAACSDLNGLDGTDHPGEHRLRRDPVVENPAGAAFDPVVPGHADRHRAHRDVFENAAVSAIAAVNVVSAMGLVANDSVSSNVVLPSAVAPTTVVSALRRCRQPVPARVVVDTDERPSRVTTDRRGFVGGFCRPLHRPVVYIWRMVER